VAIRHHHARVRYFDASRLAVRRAGMFGPARPTVSDAQGILQSQKLAEDGSIPPGSKQAIRSYERLALFMSHKAHGVFSCAQHAAVAAGSATMTTIQSGTTRRGCPLLLSTRCRRRRSRFGRCKRCLDPAQSTTPSPCRGVTMPRAGSCCALLVHCRLPREPHCLAAPEMRARRTPRLKPTPRACCECCHPTPQQQCWSQRCATSPWSNR